MQGCAGSEPDAVALRACEHLGTFTGKNKTKFLAAPPLSSLPPSSSSSLSLSPSLSPSSLTPPPLLLPSSFVSSSYSSLSLSRK
jgi:hypothetical protein